MKLTSVDFEVNEEKRIVTLVVTPIQFRMDFPYDVFIEFANKVSSVRWRIMPRSNAPLTVVTNAVVLNGDTADEKGNKTS